MSKKEEIEKKTEELLEPILDGFGFELWDVEYVKEGGEYYLRAYIDKEGGITIDDCVDVSRKLSDALDDHDGMTDDPYTLEVSSPGLGRKLVKDRELTRGIGRDVDVKFYKPFEGSKEMTGRLEGFDSKTVTVSVGPAGSETKQYVLNRSDIATIRLFVSF